MSDPLGSSIFWRRKRVRLLLNLQCRICDISKHIEVKSFALLVSKKSKPGGLYLDSTWDHKDSSKLRFAVRHGNQKWLLYTLRRFPYLVSLPNPNWTKKYRLKIIIPCRFISTRRLTVYEKSTYLSRGQFSRFVKILSRDLTWPIGMTKMMQSIFFDDLKENLFHWKVYR